MRSLLKSLMVAFGGIGPLHADCPGTPPEVFMSYPAPGVSVQEARIKDYGYVEIDTFYQDDLRRELADLFRSQRHAILAVLDSLHIRVYPDTIWELEGYTVRDRTEETMRIRVLSVLKGDVPENLYFRDTVDYFPLPVRPMSYAALKGIPIVALFNSFGHVRETGILYEDGCFFEPTAYMILGGRIHKKGLGGVRMPGISVPLDRYLAEIKGWGTVPVQIDTTFRQLPIGLGKRRIRRVFAN